MTLQDGTYRCREFVNYLIEYQLAPGRFIQHIRIPRTCIGQHHGVDTKKLEAERARDILAYLRKFEWASTEHVVFELMCEAGPRRSGIHALDVEDFEPGEDVSLHFRHRDQMPLKNNEQSERSITLYGETPDVLRDYLEQSREPTTDVYGRDPPTNQREWQDWQIDPEDSYRKPERLTRAFLRGDWNSRTCKIWWAQTVTVIQKGQPNATHVIQSTQAVVIAVARN